MDIKTLRLALDFNPNTGIFRWAEKRANIQIGDVAGCVNAKGYMYVGLGGKLYRANRLAWLYVHGTQPTGQVDHINGDRIDNRIDNLRDVTGTINQRNRLRGNRGSSSRLLGVSWHPGTSKWRSQISINRQTRHLGLFDTETAAHAAYLDAKAKL